MTKTPLSEKVDDNDSPHQQKESSHQEIQGVSKFWLHFAPIIANMLFAVNRIALGFCLPLVVIELVCHEIGEDIIRDGVSIDSKDFICDTPEVSSKSSLISAYLSLLVTFPGL